MSDVSFNEENFTPTPGSGASKPSKKTLTDRIIGWGLAKDQKQANTVLVGTLVVCLVLIALIWL
jgi:hypothetical protein